MECGGLPVHITGSFIFVNASSLDNLEHLVGLMTQNTSSPVGKTT